MIAPLRSRHRAMVTALAVLVPIGLAAAFSGRQPIPAGTIPDALDPAPAAGEGPHFRWYQQGVWGDLPIFTELVESSDGVRQVVLKPLEDLREPDVLCYWDPGAGRSGGERSSTGESVISPEAVLLGRLAGTQVRRFALPPESSSTPGMLILYSLGHDTIVAATVLEGD